MVMLLGFGINNGPQPVLDSDGGHSTTPANHAQQYMKQAINPNMGFQY